MANEEIAVELARQGQHMKSNTHRIDELEEQQNEQERQGKQIDAFESSRHDTFKYWLRMILTAAATGIIGYALAAFLQKINRKDDKHDN